MKVNEGTADRAARFVLGVAAIVIAFMMLDLTSGAILGIIVGSVGVIMLLTALVGFCPAYTLVGINTCKVKAGG